MKRSLYVAIVVVLVVTAFILGMFVARRSSTVNEPDISTSNFESRLGGYSFINPLLECNIQEVGGKEFKELNQKILSYINTEAKQGDIKMTSVYFRDLNNGPSFGINSDELFSPSSLLKVPVMLAYFKEAENNPAILQKELIFTSKTENLSQYFQPEKALQAGKKYTVEELIIQMITQSDNQALFTLGDNIAQQKIDNVNSDLGVRVPNQNTPEDYMSVKDYSAFFRILFNASYLSREYSQKALEILSKSGFDKGIVRDIPKSIPVAHKFGERFLENGSKQLHDCGIVYYPKHPYLICIMTRGNDFNNLEGVVQKISQDVYREVDKRAKTNSL